MKNVFILGIVLFFNTTKAQINIDFNTQALPEDWTMEGSFEIQNAALYPKCNQKALVGTFLNENTEFWIQPNTLACTGGDIEIKMYFGIKDLYHALGVSSSFQKPHLFVQYAEGNSDEWIEYEEVSLGAIEESGICMEYHTVISSSVLQDFENIKFRFIYQSPEQTGSLYLLYWAIDRLEITQKEPAVFPCTGDLGGGSEPSFVTIGINGTSFLHPTYSEPTEYYHQYPQAANTTATLEAGQSYTFYTFTSSEAVIAIWMDYNQNDIFEDTEYTELVNTLESQNTTSFTVSSSSNTGDIKMRIRSRSFYSAINANDACTSFGSGETRDYRVTVDHNLGIGTTDHDSNLKIYPNPTVDVINIQTSSEIQTVAVYNLMGQLVLRSKSDKIDLSQLSAGTFIVEITFSDHTKKCSKVVKK